MNKSWSVLKSFDKYFVLLLAFQYFNNGFRALISISIEYIFKENYHLDPSEAQEWEVIISLPFTLKLLYGLIADSVQICGSRKRAFFVIFGLIEIGAVLLMFLVRFKKPDPIAYLMFTVNFCCSFLDLIVDTMIITESFK